VSPQATATPELAYDLAQANGMVEPVGGAAYYGSVFGTYLVAPVVALVSTPDHKGYWLIGADASVYPSATPATRVAPGALCCRTRWWPPRRLLTAEGTGSSPPPAR